MEPVCTVLIPIRPNTVCIPAETKKKWLKNFPVLTTNTGLGNVPVKGTVSRDGG
jgi:hypothetical protein